MAKHYSQRDIILKNIGFHNYNDYLDSSLWEEIRRKFYRERGDTYCFLCREHGNVIHHYDYTYDNLQGNSFSGMYLLCHTCHEDVEFDKQGKKLQLIEQQERFRELADKNGRLVLEPKDSGISKKTPKGKLKPKRQDKPAIVIQHKHNTDSSKKKDKKHRRIGKPLTETFLYPKSDFTEPSLQRYVNIKNASKPIDGVIYDKPKITFEQTINSGQKQIKPCKVNKYIIEDRFTKFDKQLPSSIKPKKKKKLKSIGYIAEFKKPQIPLDKYKQDTIDKILHDIKVIFKRIISKIPSASENDDMNALSNLRNKIKTYLYKNLEENSLYLELDNDVNLCYHIMNKIRNEYHNKSI